MSGAKHQSPVLRAHLRKYGIDHPTFNRLKTALVTLQDARLAFRKALGETDPHIDADCCAGDCLDALQLLVHGPRGEFR